MSNNQIGTFLLCPDCSGGSDDIMNIETSGGLIYEIVNADVDWRKLESGTKIILPPDTEIIAGSKIDLNGEKPRIWVEGQQQPQQHHNPPRKILITGSSGYVGQHLLASLAFDGITSTTDDSTYELFLAYNNLPTFEGDLNDLLGQQKLHPSVVKIQPIPNVDFSKSDYIQTIQQAIGGTNLDAIVHLAALSSPAYCENHPADAWKVNCPINLTKFFHAPIIYLSTDQVYEGTKSYCQENDETFPVNVYGRTKLAFERVLLGRKTLLLSERELASDGQYMPDTESIPLPNPKSTILRSSLILGGPTPLKNGCRKGSFPSFLQFIESRLQGATPTDYFTNEFRSVVHVKDVLRAIRHFLNKALTKENSQVGLYNLGGSTRVSRYDIAVQLAKHLNMDYSTANGVERKSGGSVPSPPDISMNVNKIATEMGVTKMDGLDEIIKHTFSV